MAQLKSLLVNGTSRFLNTIYATDLNVSGETSFAGITTTGLTVNGAATVTGTLTLTKTTDLSGTANNSPALIIGGAATAKHIEIDNDEIQAKASGTSTAHLFLNYNGGIVYLSTGTKISASNGTLTAQNLNVNGTTYYFNSSGNINANGITATTATLGNASITNGEVQDFHVNGTLKTFKHDIQHIANLGGNFLVTPSFIYSKPTAQVTRVTGQSTYNLQISLTDNSTITTEIGGIAWTANSKIKAAGKINGIDIGTCDGTISSINTSSNTMIIRILIDDDVDISSISTTATDYSVSDFTVMITMVSGTNPIGIYMTADDPNSWPSTNSKGKSSISIYSGTAPGTGMSATTPVVRIGYLAGLPAIEGVTPTVTPSGWGIYTNHGYFNGVIVSQEGKIGGWTLGSNTIYSGTHNTWSHASNGLFLGTTRIAGGSGGTWYLDQNGTGKIGRWAFTSGGELSTTVSSNTAGMGNNTYAFWAGAASGNAANAPFRIKYDGSAVFTNAIIGDPDGYHVTVSNTDVGIFENATNKRASFGETVIIGKPYVSGADNNESHVEVNYHSLKMFSKEGVSYFNITDLRERDGNASITVSFIGDGESKNYYLPVLPTGDTFSVTVSDSSGGEISHTGIRVSFSTPPTDGAEITVNYITRSPDAKYFTIGSRDTFNGEIGIYSFALGYGVISEGFCSFAEGNGTTASGGYSHAEGRQTTASGNQSHAQGFYTTASKDNSHAEGYETTASGNYSHAEGYETIASGSSSHAEGEYTTASGSYSHAEGNYATASRIGSHAEGCQTTASGYASHAEGARTTASGESSHAQNYYTIATGTNQTVIGKFNSATVSGSGTDSDPYVYTNVGDYAFIIGNGTYNTTAERSNAFTVDWNGGIEMDLDVDSSASSSTAATSGTDKDLFNAIRALGWYDDVIS